MADYVGYERAFKRFNLPYTVEPGAYERGHGDMSGFRYLALHHTAGGGDAGDIRIVRDGRSDLPGPLSQLVFKRDGTMHIVAVGVCYHAPSKINFKGVSPGNGNQWSIGIEGVSNGYNDWTPAQRENYPKYVAALVVDAGLSTDSWKFHRDLQPGEKIDPAGFEQGWFQRAVDAFIAGGGVPMKTAIQQKYLENQWLGKATMKEEELPCGPDGKGRFRTYEGGSIYWHVAFGARTINNNILPKYAERHWEMGALGYPVGDAKKIDGGECQPFQGGAIYFQQSTGNAFMVGGKIGDRWGELDWERGLLGYPQGDEIGIDNGVIQQFTNGYVYFSPKTGAREIYYAGGFWEEFARVGHEATLGFPSGSPIISLDRRGTIQSFERGAIYHLNGWKNRVTGKEDANALWGRIFEIYAKLGYENGRLGFPITDVYDTGELEPVTRADFEGGSIEINWTEDAEYLVLSGKRVDVPPLS